MSVMGWKKLSRRRARIRRALLAVIVFIFALPLAWTILASLGVHPDTGALRLKWTFPPSLESYAEVGTVEPAFLKEIATSLAVSTVSTGLTLFVSFLAAYALARSRRRRMDARVQGFLILASLPVMAYVMPLTGTVRALHFYDTFAGVCLAQTAIFAPLAVYVLFGYLRQVSPDYEEAAYMDGASPLRILLRIILPAHALSLAATGTILFVLNWNSFLIPMMLTTSHVRTVPISMSDFFILDRELEWPTAAAALVVSLLPLVVMVIAANRLIARFVLGGRREAQ
jgi:multiple sugar transport system permease protein